jgi:HSP20 family protein
MSKTNPGDAHARGSEQNQSSRSGSASQSQSGAGGTQSSSSGRTSSGESTRSGSSAARTEQQRPLETSRESGVASESHGLRRRGGLLTPFGALSDPFTMMQEMADQMDSLFASFGLPRLAPASQQVSRGRQSANVPSRFENRIWAPQMDVFRRGDELVVRADLPGLSRDDVNVDIEDDVLTIQGERRQENEENREGIYRSERSYGSFYRAIPLPEGIDADQAKATFKDGVLEVTLPAPREQQRRGRRVEIEQQ